jgi:hypothetical protein
MMIYSILLHLLDKWIKITITREQTREKLYNTVLYKGDLFIWLYMVEYVVYINLIL